MTAPKLTADEIAEAFGVGLGAVTYHAIRAGYATRGEARVPTTVEDEEPVDVIAWRPPDWTEWALCAQTDPEIFFPEKGGTTKPAIQVCRRCEVAAECLDQALANGERFGIWGGLPERKRRTLATIQETTS